MKDLRPQERDLIFALDIGTRSVVGVVGRPAGGRFKALDIEMAEHGSRAMLDGQIDNIHQVGGLARTVTERLEERLGVHLERVCVAAAGRALRTQSGSFAMDLSEEKSISAETISRLEAGALSAAEEALQVEDEVRRQFFMVGYTVAQYRLDNYPLASLLDHTGQKAEADVVATFLPGEVVESLYAAMRAANLQVSSLTLEPIAAMNAAIPAELRLLNLALVDIGAGTTDIAVCRDGSVTGYTMATIAGDEITEAIMRTFLVDFQTAEEMKRNLRPGEDSHYTDILGLENTASFEDVHAAIQEPMNRLAEAIAVQVTELNGGPPSALFLAGGGSKLEGLREKVASSLNMDERRVAIAGNNFVKSAFADELDLNNPEYATPLGIAVSAGLGLLNDSYVITLNGERAKLFRSGVLTIRDILLMNGYTYADMLGRSGKNLGVTLNGRHMVLRGEPAAPAILRVNGEEAAINAVVHAGDNIRFQPARSGKDAAKTLGELLGKGFSGRVLLNNQEGNLKTALSQGDVILTLEGPSGVVPPALPETPPVSQVPEASRPAPEEAPPEPVKTEPVREKEPEASKAEPPETPRVEPVKPLIRKREVEILLNGKPLVLPPKENGQPYYVMDLLERSGVDFEKLEGPVHLAVNGTECGFSQTVRDRDSITIH
ncbi:MAG: pilus assembly protein PilM [Oscillibacter sp.]|nr:pilus assembly protein PilM [Oscillibacter sp.]